MGAKNSRFGKGHRRNTWKTSSESQVSANQTDYSSSQGSSMKDNVPVAATIGSFRSEDVIPTSTGSINDKYELKHVLGKGNFSTVRLGVTRQSRNGKTQRVAVKCVKKRKLSAKDLEGLKQECAILRMLDHPNIIKLYDLFEDDELYYIVTEYVPGGELFDRIVQKEYYKEEDAQVILIKIAKALHFCHEAGVVHRDLKPENILLASKVDDAEIKICDFGFAKTVDPDDPSSLATSCGTPGYVAPEVLNSSKYGKQVDIWSLGVITYILLCGYPPFRASNRASLFRLIRKAEFEFEDPWWTDVSDDAKDLVRSMLTLDPSQRITIPEMLEHPWLKEASDKDITPALAALERFNAQRRVAAAQMAIIATKTMSKLAAERRKIRSAFGSKSSSAAKSLNGAQGHSKLAIEDKIPEEYSVSTASGPDVQPSDMSFSFSTDPDASRSTMESSSQESSSTSPVSSSKSLQSNRELQSRPSLASMKSGNTRVNTQQELNPLEVLEKLDEIYDELDKRVKKLRKKMHQEERKLQVVVDKLIVATSSTSLLDDVKDNALVLLKRKRVIQRQIETIITIQSELEEHAVAIEASAKEAKSLSQDTSNAVTSHLLINSSTTSVLDTPISRPTTSTFTGLSALIDDVITESAREVTGKRMMESTANGMGMITEALHEVGGVQTEELSTRKMSVASTNSGDNPSNEEDDLAEELEKLQEKHLEQSTVASEVASIHDVEVDVSAGTGAPVSVLNFQLKALELPTLDADANAPEHRTIWGSSDDEKVATTLRELHTNDIPDADTIPDREPPPSRHTSARRPGTNRGSDEFSPLDVSLAALAAAALGPEPKGSQRAAKATRTAAASVSAPELREPTGAGASGFPMQPLPPNADMNWARCLAYFTAFAPEFVAPGEQFELSVWAHPGFEKEGTSGPHLGAGKGPMRIRIGAELVVELHLDSPAFGFLHDGSSRAKVAWLGQPRRTSFALQCQPGAKDGRYLLRAVLYVLGKPRGALNCPVAVASDPQVRKQSLMDGLRGREPAQAMSASLLPNLDLGAGLTLFPSKRRPHVYLSYAPGQSSVAKRVRSTLENLGYVCYMPAGKFSPTQPVSGKAQSRLSRAAVVVPIVTPAPSGKSRTLSKLSYLGAVKHYADKGKEIMWHAEVRMALKDPSKMVIPLGFLTDFEAECDGLPADLEDFSELNYRMINPDKLETSVVALHNGIQKVLIAKEKIL